MKRNCYYIFLLSFFTYHTLPAQVDLTTMYPQNYYLVNAATAGQDSCWHAYTGYRRQWTGIKTGPSQGYISLNGRIGRSQGIGVFIEQSKTGLLSYLNGKVSYAFHYMFANTSAIHVGVSAGFNHQKLDISNVTASDYSDDILTRGSQPFLAVNSDIGVAFSTRRLLLGVSLPHVLHSNTTGETGTEQFGHFFVHGSYAVIDNATWLCQSIAAYRTSNLQGDQADIGARLLWKDQYGVSLGYRTNNSLFLKSELKVNGLVTIAYSFEPGASNSRRSHEIMVGIRLRKKKKPQEPAFEEITKAAPGEFSPEVKRVEQDTLRDRRTREVNTPADKTEKTINLDSLNSAFAATHRLIMFELNSSDKILSGNRDEVLNAVVEIINENSRLRITVVGHTCKLGHSGVNKKISEARAKEIAEALESRGIPADVMECIGKGEIEPVNTGTSPADLAENRRVQIVFSNK